MYSPEQLADLAEIGQVLQRYAKALDDKDYKLLDQVFTPDAQVNYELGARVTRTRYAELGRVMEAFNAVFAFTSHLISPPLVELAGDAATTETKLVATHGWERHSGERGTWIVVGFYRDVLVRGANGWRIRERRFHGLSESGDLPPRDALRTFAKPVWAAR